MKRLSVTFGFVTALLFAATMFLASCSKSDDSKEAVTDYTEEKSNVYSGGGPTESLADEAMPGVPGGSSGTGQGGNTQAGVVTAGEWSDLGNWTFWAGLMQSEDFSDKSSYWMCYTNNRVAVKVTDPSGNPLAGISVKLQRQTDDGIRTLWEALTDNHGLADCWAGLWQQENFAASALSISVDGQQMEGHPSLTSWEAPEQMTVNTYAVTPATAPDMQTDIAFVVDATGSMSDEIDFLKNDLTDIINQVKELRPDQTIRTAALFYRDEGDEYLTRHSDFTADVTTTKDFVENQQADGGGDYPEAVHTALEKMLTDLSWNGKARTRLAFMLLDAPAHHETDIIASLQESVARCARLGIRLIPVAASGVDKNTEFMLRFFSIATGGTYVFLTNDSGVGLDHIAASVGDYEVEQLNRLLIRLIKQYTE